jgi:GNAT superfamily N-acetyltransferase
MKVEIVSVTPDSNLIREFIYLPSRLYQNSVRWVPPIYADEWNFHNIKKNRALEYCDTIRLLAYIQGEPVGRIMGIIHHPYNTSHGEKTARFFSMDCINQDEVAGALIQAIEQWARERGMNKVIGPFGFSDKDPQGAQIEGFEYLPVLATPTNPDYLPDLIANQGYGKEIDCISYCIKIPEKIPSTYQKIYSRVSQNPFIKLIEFNSKRELKPYILPVLQLVNETYTPIFGFSPLQKEEMIKLAAQYLPVLDPAFVKVVVNQSGDLIAFVVAMSDMSAGIQKARGRLLPLGFLHILLSMRKAKQLNLMLGAIKPGFRGVGISVLMGKSILESALQRKMKLIDSHLILENNFPMRGECEKLNGKVYKRFRIFSKKLV